MLIPRPFTVMSANCLICLISALCLVSTTGYTQGDEPNDEIEHVRQQMVSRAINYMIAQQREDGSFNPETGTAVTSLAATSLIRHGRTIDDPVVSKALEYILSKQQDDGGIYDERLKFKNYETSLAVMCLAEVNDSGRYDETIAKADKFLKQLQWDESEDIDVSSESYGGGGYGKHQRPDLSNTSFLIEALRSAGNDENSEAIQRALIFVSRSQNLESEHNQTAFAAIENDGGFYYTPAAGGSSQAGTTPRGGLRSYASMTYAGLKSMIYAGVDKNDQRVQAAMKWLQRHYDLQSNPGLDAAGLYYYYHTFAKTLDALGEPIFIDSTGEKHNWRIELIRELKRRQQDNGSWVNSSNDRWMEGNPELVTSYALLALSHCQLN